MLQINDHEPARKLDDGHTDNDSYVVRAIARRFGLSASVAHLVCELAHIGGGDQRTTTGKSA